MSQVWLITGSSRGLGRALADAVLAAGHRLVATARDPGRLSDLVARHGDRVRAVALDVTDERAAKGNGRRVAGAEDKKVGGVAETESGWDVIRQPVAAKMRDKNDQQRRAAKKIKARVAPRRRLRDG